ncbi:MAG: Cna B-type domain-containing protein [Clostridiales bacterium]|nr:Cna B-type domain-containing protein [Clostridiales bacterium]
MALITGVCLALAVSAYAGSDVRRVYVGEGVTFSIYKIGTADSEGNFVPEEAFKNYKVDFEDENCALTLAIYVERDGIDPVMTAVTDSESAVTFSNLSSGEYLILGSDFTEGSKVYTAQPVIISIGEYTGGEVEITEKYSVSELSEGSGVTSVSVMKVWSGGKAESITAQLLKNGSVADEVVLNDSNNWRHTWSGLDENSVWHVTEKEVPDGYKLRVDEDGSVFILVNTEGSEEESGETTTEGPSETTSEGPPETTTNESGGGGGETTTEAPTEATTDSETEATTDSDSEETTKPPGGGGGSETTTENTTETDSDTETPTKKPSGGGGGGGSYYPETSTEATTEGSGGPPDSDTETPPPGSSDDSPGSNPPGSSSGSADSSGSGDTSDGSSSSTASDSSSDSAHVPDDSSAGVTNGGEASGAGAPPEGETATLPQTGQLWYPVPILLWIGIIFLVLGIRRKSVSL